MTPYQQFIFSRSRNANLTGLIVALTMLVAFYKIDSLVLPEDMAPIGSLVRFGLLLPLLIIAFVSCFRRQNMLFSYTTTTAILFFMFWWYFALLDSNTDSPLPLFTATLQALIVSSLLITLPLKAHLFSLSVIGLLVISALLFFPFTEQKQSIVFGLGCGGAVLLLSHLVLLRERRNRELFTAFQTSHSRLRARKAWNNFISKRVQALNEENTKTIHSQLQQLARDNPDSRFLSRAHHSISEIANLMHRFSSSNDWSRFYDPGKRHLFSMQQHVLEVLAETQIKHVNAKFHINVTKDFECQVEKSLITRLLVNIIENALRASTHGAPVFIEINADKVVAIENTGAPLDRPLSELTTPGRKHSNPGQFGLGLYVCSKICKANGLGLIGKNTKTGVRFEIHFAPGSQLAKELSC